MLKDYQASRRRAKTKQEEKDEEVEEEARERSDEEFDYEIVAAVGDVDVDAVECTEESR